MLNLLRNKSQLYLLAPEPLSVTVLSRQDAEEQAPTFGSNDFVVSIGNPEQTELHFPCRLFIYISSIKKMTGASQKNRQMLSQRLSEKKSDSAAIILLSIATREYLEVRALLLRFCVHLDSMKELFWMMADIVSMAGAISTCAAHLA